MPQEEGSIPGVGAKMFTIADYVIAYGVSVSVVYGFNLLDNNIVLIVGTPEDECPYKM